MGGVITDGNIPVYFYAGKIDYNNNGTIITGNDYAYSDLIPIEAGKKYYIESKDEGVTYNGIRMVYYDENGNYLSVSDSMGSVGENEILGTVQRYSLPMISAAAAFRLRFSLNSYQINDYPSWYTGALEYLNKNMVMTWQRADSITNILKTYPITYNQRWSSTSSAYSSCPGMITFTIPWNELKGKALRLKGFPGNIKASSKETTFYWLDSANAKMDVQFYKDPDGTSIYSPNIWLSNGTYEDDGVYCYQFILNNINGFTNANATNVMISLPIKESANVVESDLEDLIITINEEIN